MWFGNQQEVSLSDTNIANILHTNIANILDTNSANILDTIWTHTNTQTEGDPIADIWFYTSCSPPVTGFCNYAI